MRRILIKTLLIFLALNLLMAAGNPLPALGRITLYNGLFPGRERFPFGENPQQAYNFSLYSMEAMFASHELTGREKAKDEYRLILLGDSSVWGTLLKPEETLAGQINALHLQTCDGKTVRAYNLGYPTLSVTKDLMILDEARQYEPDAVWWLVTLEGLPAEKQLVSPLAANNPARLDALAASTGVVDPAAPAIIRPDFWERTILGLRRPLADLLRLQLYGVMWSATGIDQFYPVEYPPAAVDLEADESFHDRLPPTLDESSLLLDVLDAGARLLGDVPLTVINEPILMSDGQNSDLRYNFFYPRWAYDQYRVLLAEQAATGGWTLVDRWDLLPKTEFTNSAIHLTPNGSTVLAESLAGLVACGK
jgi:hypothetical protein